MASLRTLPIAFRALFSSYLILIGIGYLMALVYMYAVVIEPHLQMGEGIVAGISDEYHGLPKGQSLLEEALMGPDGRPDIGSRSNRGDTVGAERRESQRLSASRTDLRQGLHRLSHGQRKVDPAAHELL